mgnify:CR=1 FL=1
MHFARVYSAQTEALTGHIVSVEADLSRGLFSFTVIGLPDKAVEEARDRVSAAIKHSELPAPKTHNRKIVVSLAPASLKKEGSHFDLAIALAYLLAADDIRFKPDGKLFLGELALDGGVRKIAGVLPLVRAAKEKGFKEVYVPEENREEAALVRGVSIYGVATLGEVVDHLDTKQKKMTGSKKKQLTRSPETVIGYAVQEFPIDISDVRRQEAAKRALEIAAAGGHNVALYGPAGTGKTMLARAFSSILPPLSEEEVLEVTGIHSVAGALREPYLVAPPFRSPHHTASYVSLVGGTANPRPGEITLAHRGVLFLDEFPEFERRVLEALREPLEDKTVSVSRSRGTVRFPANFILIAAMNPCPCGNAGTNKRCLCLPGNVERYRRKLSGPIIDRIDMWIEVPYVEHMELLNERQRQTSEMSEAVRARVAAARARSWKRFIGTKKKTNSDMTTKDIEKLSLSTDIKEVLAESGRRLMLSPRSIHRILKLSRTIADLAGEEKIALPHVLEALQYRPKILTA